MLIENISGKRFRLPDINKDVSHESIWLKKGESLSVWLKKVRV